MACDQLRIVVQVLASGREWEWASEVNALVFGDGGYWVDDPDAMRLLDYIQGGGIDRWLKRPTA
jgi:hypothetical protein